MEFALSMCTMFSKEFLNTAANELVSSPINVDDQRGTLRIQKSIMSEIALNSSDCLCGGVIE